MSYIIHPFLSALIYLIADQGSVPFMRDIMDNLGLSAVNSIMLDGSGSTQMQAQSNGTWINPVSSSRHIFNMIRLKNI